MIKNQSRNYICSFINISRLFIIICLSFFVIILPNNLQARDITDNFTLVITSSWNGWKDSDGMREADNGSGTTNYRKIGSKILSYVDDSKYGGVYHINKTININTTKGAASRSEQTYNKRNNTTGFSKRSCSYNGNILTLSDESLVSNRDGSMSHGSSEYKRISINFANRTCTLVGHAENTHNGRTSGVTDENSTYCVIK